MEKRPDYEVLVNQEGQKRTDLQKDREVVELLLKRINERLSRAGADEQLTPENLSDLAQALYSCTETLAMIETVEAGRPLTLTW